jgi:hypothetical protein
MDIAFFSKDKLGKQCAVRMVNGSRCGGVYADSKIKEDKIILSSFWVKNKKGDIVTKSKRAVSLSNIATIQWEA